MWRPRLIEKARMKSRGIVDALEADINSGDLIPGDRLPPQRAIAEALGVDLTTVTRAFNEARRRGLIDARAGRGTFVRFRAGSADAAAHPLIDLSMNIPSQPADIDFGKLLPAGIAAVLAGPRGLLNLHYQESTGAGHDRRAGARWLGARMAGVTPERVLVTGGAQAALFSICGLLLAKGDVVAAGAVTYPGLKAVAAQIGLKLEPLDMDDEGIVPDAFEKACRERVVKALYVIPSIDNPTTATLPEDRRRRLVEIARMSGVAIVEDDPYAPLREERKVAMAELAPDITWHIATLSKCATPALRIAYVVTPGIAETLRLAGALRASVLMAPPLMSALATRWIADGTLAAITHAIRRENAERQRLAASLLAGADMSADPQGHHVWLRLPAPWRAADFAARADRVGVSVVPGSAFSIMVHFPEAVRLSLGVALDRGDLEDGLMLLAGILSQPELGAKAVV